MSLVLNKMSKGKSSFPRIPEGTYMGRMVTIVDLGNQAQTDWKTKEPAAPKDRLLITWELPSETIEIENSEGEVEEKPRWISKEYTLSSFEQANLMKLISAFDKSIGSVADLIGVGCMINVGSTASDNAKVVSVVPAPAGIPIPELSTEPYTFDFDEPQEELFVGLPQWLQDKITSANNYNGFADNWGE